MGGKSGGGPAKRLPGKPFKSISVDDPAKCFFWHDDSKPWARGGITAMTDEKEGSGNFFAVGDQLAKGFCFVEAKGSAKFFAAHFLYAVFAKLLRPLARRRFSTF